MNTLLVISFLFLSIQPTFSVLKLKLNQDKSILYLYHEEQCSWWGNYGSNCIKPHVSGQHVIVTDTGVNEILKSMVTGWTWIGAKKYKNDTEYLWFNDERLNYTNWRDGEPDAGPFHREFDGPDYCVDIEVDGKWSDAPCYYAKHALLQFDVTPTLGRQLYVNISGRGEKLSEDAIKTLEDIDDGVRPLIASGEADLKMKEAELEEIEDAIEKKTGHQLASVHQLISGLIRISKEDLNETNERIDQLFYHKNGMEIKMNEFDENLEYNEHIIGNMSVSIKDIFNELNGKMNVDDYSSHDIHIIGVFMLLMIICVGYILLTYKHKVHDLNFNFVKFKSDKTVNERIV